MWILKRKSLFCECFKCPERTLLPRREPAQTNPTSTMKNAKKEGVGGGRKREKRKMEGVCERKGMEREGGMAHDLTS